MVLRLDITKQTFCKTDNNCFNGATLSTVHKSEEDAFMFDDEFEDSEEEEDESYEDDDYEEDEEYEDEEDYEDWEPSPEVVVGRATSER